MARPLGALSFDQPSVVFTVQPEVSLPEPPYATPWHCDPVLAEHAAVLERLPIECQDRIERLLFIRSLLAEQHEGRLKPWTMFRDAVAEALERAGVTPTYEAVEEIAVTMKARLGLPVETREDALARWSRQLHTIV